MPRTPPERTIDAIRRAAFELRQSDPQEAVRVLRRAAEAGDDVEVLARGALAEIYLEEFGDLDAAEAEFRRVLSAAPGLAAAELGLARTLREQGALAEADAGYDRALRGLAADLERFRADGAAPEGAEEVVLTLLETALERLGLGRCARELPFDPGLVRWARDRRLFDADDEDGSDDDWTRFHQLWAALLTACGRPSDALASLEEAERAGELTAAGAAGLLSALAEEQGDAARAGLEAERSLRALPRPWPLGAVVRARALLGESGRALAEEALRDATVRAAAAPEDEELREEVRALREALGVEAVVQLGLARPKG